MKKKVFFLVLALSLVLLATVAVANVEGIKMYVNGNEVKSDVPPVKQENRVLVPVRFIAEALGCDVQWDEAKNAVIITRNSGDKFLRGKNDPAQQKPSIHTNFIKAADLMAALDDDKDGDICDYRDGHSGGDSIANDPLVVDTRTKKDYDTGHI
ncbi:MAG: copper amine oxidase N-terminal domain-containing protein, partial [Firmicutes bacterium]|nr:copper amine oxidase N-terminal domain-containing protein [Bacillota bacterium]